MSTSVWKGHISFGMVSFPVKLYAAARSQTVSFNQLHQCDHSRVARSDLFPDDGNRLAVIPTQTPRRR